MSQGLLCIPALLPIAGGMILLLAAHFGPVSAGQKRQGKSSGKEFGAGKKALGWRLNLYVEGLTVLNSLVLLWLIVHSGENQPFILFRLYGGLTVMFKLDRMGRVFAGLIAFLWPLAVLYSFEYMKGEARRATFFAYYLMTYGVTAGIAMAGSMITLYLFYELLTLVTFPLVLYPMTREAVRASRKYLYYSIGGAAFAFVGLVFILGFSASGTTEFMPGGMLDTAAAGARRNTLLTAYVLAFFGFGVKAALFPCHGWLPKATVAPTPVTALLHAVAVVKSGAFAIMRLTYFSFGASFLRGSWAQWVVLTAAMVTIVYGSTMAVKEVHWKRRLAYSTISNLSYILMGAAMMSPLGLAAALSHMVVHALMKICSFFCAGAVMHQTGKTHIYELDGLAAKMPLTFVCLTVASLSLTGIPLFGGFISKWNLARAGFSLGLGSLESVGSALGNSGFGNGGSGSVQWLGFAAVAVLLYSALMTAVYMLTVLVRAYFPKLTGLAGAVRPVAGAGSPAGVHSASGSGSTSRNVHTVNGSGSLSDYRDPNGLMLVPLVIFSVLILFLGIHSQPLMTFLTGIGGEAGW